MHEEAHRGEDESRLEGIGVAPGVARGVAHVYGKEDETPPVYEISSKEVPNEIARFEAALVTTRGQISEMQKQIESSLGSKDAAIFDAHLLVVEDRTLIDEVMRTLELEQRNIESVFHEVAKRYGDTLSEMDDPYLRERALDIHDVTRRVLRNLMGKPMGPLVQPDYPYILVAHDLTPSDTATMDRDLVLAFATDLGSKTSHTAIMARSMKLPAVVGLHNATREIESGNQILVDGYNGLLIVNPTNETLWGYGELEMRKGEVEQKLTALRETESTTKDAYHITLSANVELPEDIEAVRGSGAEGIGLYRTEFFFQQTAHPPDEERHYENYHAIAAKLHPHYVIIRTLDLGGDKISESLQDVDEKNPFLGWRAIRFCLDRPEIFKPQLRAVLRASAVGNVRLMYPMISGVTELRRANAVLEECRDELRESGTPFDENMEVGIMIEIPSAALTADVLAQEVDFFSIGTNDLIQYSIAIDRLNDRITDLYQPTHPGIVRLIRQVVDAAHAAGIWVGLCGEMAGDVVLTPLLLGLEIDELSTSIGLVPRVKSAVQQLDMAACRTLIDDIARIGTAEEILERCQAVAQAHYPELLD